MLPLLFRIVVFVFFSQTPPTEFPHHPAAALCKPYVQPNFMILKKPALSPKETVLPSQVQAMSQGQGWVSTPSSECIACIVIGHIWHITVPRGNLSPTVMPGKTLLP